MSDHILYTELLALYLLKKLSWNLKHSCFMSSTWALFHRYILRFTGLLRLVVCDARVCIDDVMITKPWKRQTFINQWWSIGHKEIQCVLTICCRPQFCRNSRNLSFNLWGYWLLSIVNKSQLISGRFRSPSGGYRGRPRGPAPPPHKNWENEKREKRKKRRKGKKEKKEEIRSL